MTPARAETPIDDRTRTAGAPAVPDVPPAARSGNDVLAGIVVFLVALPLCLGIASASGVEPFAGVLSGIVGGLVVALLSGSRLSVSGPAAGLVVIVVEAIASLGSFSAFLLAVMLAGLMQLGFGVLRAGRFAAYVPSAVVKGMLASIGILLITNQLSAALALDPGDSPAGAALAQGLHGVATPFGTVSLIALAVTLLSIGFLFAWETAAFRRNAFVRKIPAPLLVVLIGIGATLLLRYVAPGLAMPSDHLVSLPALPSFAALKEAIDLPDFHEITNPAVWRVAVTLAIVASLETLLCLEAVEQIDPLRQKAPADRELKAQGVGNLIAGALGGLPITSVIVRSSANVNAGAKSRWSAVIHGLLLLLSVFALTSVINLIPLACLAAILIATGYKLAHPKLFIGAAREGLDRLVPFLATIVGVLATDLLTGIGIGIVASIVMALQASLMLGIRFSRHDDHCLLSFRKDVSFLGKVKLKQHLAEVPDGATLIIDASRVDFVDPDVREAIDEFIAGAPARGIHIDYKRAPSAGQSRRRVPAWLGG